MKDLIRRLERSHAFWFLSGLSFVFFLLRLPSLFEPYWYGDEGIYQTLGLALTRGRILYTGIWDNKPPLLYYTYALVHSSQFLIRLLSLLVGLVAVSVFFALAKRLFRDEKASIIATGVFVFLFGLPLFEGNIANAENFMLVPIIASGLLVYQAITDIKNTHNSKYQLLDITYIILAGFLLGIAFLYKIVAIFDFSAFFVFIVIATFGQDFSFKKIITYLKVFARPLILFCLSFVFPFFLTLIYFALHKGVGEYIHAIFLSTVGYVGYKNAFIIPQGLLISKILLLAIFTIFLFLKRQKITRPTLFILLWVAFSLFNSFFSQRPYTHYVLVLLPAFSLLVGKTYFSRTTSLIKYVLLTLVLITITFHYFDHWNFSKTVRYYTNFISFVSGHSSVTAYDSFFDQKTLRDQKIIQYINTNKKDHSTLYVWGNDAQIYPLTNTIPPGRFTVAYHVAGIQPYVAEMRTILKQNPPSFVVIMTDVPAYPFELYNYRQVLRVQNADIYERIY